MTTMIEKVARALEEEMARQLMHNGTWSDLARAAIEAMREPTLGMLSDEICDRLERDMDHMTPMGSLNMAYMDMIEAALKEKS